MKPELALRDLHQTHEPDPAFLAELEQRLDAELQRAEPDGPIGDDDGLAAYVPPTDTRPVPERRLRPALLAAVATIVLLVLIAVLVRQEDEEPPPVGPIGELPANGWVAQQFGDSIWLMRDGEEDLPIDLLPPGSEACPAFSPDGERLMVGRGDLDGGNARLDIVRAAADSSQSQLVTIPLDGVEEIPCAIWAPDGRWAALGSDGDVLVVDTETADVRRLPDHAPSDLEWRPGTDELAIAGDGPVEIYSVSTDEVRTLEGIEAAELTWSPDGTTLAYRQDASGSPDRRSGIWLVDADGGDPRPLTTTEQPAQGIGIVWSPRGDQIAYTRERTDCDRSACNERTEIVLVTAIDAEPDTPLGAERALPPIVDNLAPGPFTERHERFLGREPWLATSITWSPDGTQLLYAAQLAGVFAVPVDGSRVTILSPDGLVGMNDDITTAPFLPLQQWQPVP